MGKKEKFRKIRFPSDPNTIASLSEDLEDKKLSESWLGLAVNESHHGCNIAFISSSGSGSIG